MGKTNEEIETALTKIEESLVHLHINEADFTDKQFDRLRAIAHTTGHVERNVQSKKRGGSGIRCG